MKYSIDVFGDVITTGKWPKTKHGALNESILKWEWLVKQLEGGKLEKVPWSDYDSCAPCAIYLDTSELEEKWCIGCPVMQKTGKSQCENSPYYKYQDQVGGEEMKPAIRAAKAEVKFLKSLLPKQAVAKG